MTFALGDLRGTRVYEELGEICRSYSVLISPIPDLRVGGSGTLVRYKNLCGILTATHVLAKNIDSSLIFSPVLKTPDPTYFLKVAVPVKKLLYLETAAGIKALQGPNWPNETLDICLIQLDPSLFDFLLKISGKKAVDLLAHKTKYLTAVEKYCAADHNNDWSWAFDGVPREGSIQNSQGILQSKFGGPYLGGGTKEGSTYKAQQLTLVTPPFDGTADIGRHDLGPTADPLPYKFGGISGGGVHQVSFKGESGTPEAIDEMFFSGVCVAGIPQQCLYSRGPASLYEVFTRYLDTLDGT
jgi:hypothetical protein